MFDKQINNAVNNAVDNVVMKIINTKEVEIKVKFGEETKLTISFVDKKEN